MPHGTARNNKKCPSLKGIFPPDDFPVAYKSIG